MSKPKDGGPAFPTSRMEDVPLVKGGKGHSVVNLDVEYSGLSIRDYFAAKAINVIRPVYEVTSEPPKPNDPQLPPISKIRAGVIAREAYEVADAMLAERERRGKGE